MKLLDRYIYRHFIYYFLLTLISLTGIYLLIDFFDRLDTFQERQVSSALMARYFFLKIPLILDQISPISLLLAGIISLGILINSGESQVLTGAGVSIKRILRPYLLAASAVTFCFVGLAQWLVPTSGVKLELLWQKEVMHNKNIGHIRNGVFFVRGRKGIYTFLPNDHDGQSLSDFRYISFGDNNRQKLSIYAAAASWLQDEWRFREGQIKFITSQGSPSTLSFASTSLKLPETQADISFPPASLSQMKLTEIFCQAMNQKSGSRSKAVRDVNRRFSFLLFGLPLLLSGLPLLFRIQMKWHKIALAFAVSASFFFAFCAWGVWSVMQAMVQASLLEHFIASWFIHVTSIFFGLFQIANLTRGNIPKMHVFPK